MNYTGTLYQHFNLGTHKVNEGLPRQQPPLTLKNHQTFPSPSPQHGQPLANPHLLLFPPQQPQSNIIHSSPNHFHLSHGSGGAMFKYFGNATVSGGIGNSL